MSPGEFWRLTPSEWWLMLEGHTGELRRQNRLIARWVSPIMSALTQSTIPAEVLLGEKTTEQVAAEDQERKIREGSAREKHVLRQLKKLKSSSTKKDGAPGDRS